MSLRAIAWQSPGDQSKCDCHAIAGNYMTFQLFLNVFNSVINKKIPGLPKTGDFYLNSIRYITLPLGITARFLTTTIPS